MTYQTPAVGLIGIGLMGEALARRLIGSGSRVVGYDIEPDKVRRLEALGGEAAPGVAHLARQCDMLVLAVFDTDQVEAVVQNDLLPVLDGKSGKILLCTSTCDPDRIASLGARLAESGVAFLEVPVSGTSEQVKRGEGVGLIGGDPEVVARAKSVLSPLFPMHFHVGKIGDAGRAKLAVNLILGLNRVALAEGWYLPSGSGSILQLSCRLRAARPPTRRSWTPRAGKWSTVTSRQKGGCGRP